MVDGDSDDALVCCIENTVEDRIMDSGPSFHATYCKEELEKIKLRTSKTLKDVRYISCLKRMLISVGQLNEEGYHIGFRDQQWKVTKGSIVVARGNKRGSLYMVEDWRFGEAEEAFLHNVREDKETTKVGETGVAVGLRISEEEWRGKDTSLTHLKAAAQMKCDTSFEIRRVTELPEAEILHLWTRFMDPGAQIRVRGPKTVGASRIVDDQIKNTLNTEYPPRREAPRLHKYEDPPESPGLWVKEEHNSNKRLVLSIVAAEDLHLEQLDVKTTFLHGDLDEDIYMTQPEGFQSAGKEENLVCKLKTSLYGSKQASRQWYLKLDNSVQKDRVLIFVEDSWNKEPCRDVHQVGDEREVEALRNLNFPPR
ncbi:retrovirus-related pol polyprotein from transposon TNT 1-94 [Tanacetum coccineum]